MNHQVDHSDLDHAFTALGQRLVVFGQSAVLAEPREGAFDDPSLRQHDESVQFRTFDDFHGAEEPAAGPVHKLSRIAAVGEDQLQSAKAPAQLPNNESATVAILNIGGMNDQRHDQPERVNEDVPFSPGYLLARVVTAIPPFSAVLIDWLSRMPTLGVGFLPTFLRTRVRSRS